MARPTAAPLILHFLRHAGQSRVERIVRYMDSQWNTPSGTTRNTLSKLVRTGRVERVGYGRYAIGIAASGGADNNTAGLTTQRSDYYTEG